ncbi:MAG: hypothetical protein HN712_28095 [Gemmatimonadetes bacterium]|nr:hypothetical protein [Gemmatimonadota bacterium]MBT7864205.1 hypothetical protein [Gemmatimonadota bacterium]
MGLRSLMMCSLLIANCGEQGVTGPESPSGAARVAVSLSSLGLSSIGRVGATVSGADMDTIRQDLQVGVDSVASGVIANIPVGTGRKLALAVYSDEEIVTHAGFAAGLSVTRSDTLAVSIALLPLQGAISVMGRILTDNEPVEYEVTFEATWSALTHPGDFPPAPHFSGLIGVLHNSNVTFWLEGDPATDGIRQMAERGAKIPLQAEFLIARNNNNAGGEISAGEIRPSPGVLTTSFEATPEFPLVTLVTMIAPSPDWFAGTQSLSLLDSAGQWHDEIQFDLFPHDAGSDGGPSYTSPNDPLEPPLPISALRLPPFKIGDRVPSLGSFTFRRR